MEQLPGPECQRRERCRLGNEPRHSLGHNAPFLRPRSPLNEHDQVQVASGQPFQGVLGDRPEPVFLDIPQDTIFKISFSQTARVEVAQHALDLAWW